MFYCINEIIVQIENIARTTAVRDLKHTGTLQRFVFFTHVLAPFGLIGSQISKYNYYQQHAVEILLSCNQNAS